MTSFNHNQYYAIPGATLDLLERLIHGDPSCPLSESKRKARALDIVRSSIVGAAGKAVELPQEMNTKIQELGAEEGVTP